MKRNLFFVCLFAAVSGLFAQTPRLSLYEEFTGETCPPCASTNPGLNLLLHSATNTPKIVSIKWQVPIPSAPTNTWSLYQTNKTEIDWRWKSGVGNYGYNPAINSAPSSKIDGREATVFGAASGHPANLTNGVIATAQSYTSAFQVNMTRDWDATGSSINVTVTIQATAPFTSVGNLIFRCVMVEEKIVFATPPGSNGEKIFEDAAIRSFPTLQAGTAMANTWAIGETQTFVLNCPIPTYTRKKEEIAFVGFIQDDGNQRVAQAYRLGKALLTNDAVAIAAKVDATCSGNITPMITVSNNGANAITALTITPYVDGVAQSPFPWTGSIASNASTNITINTLTTSTTSGPHTFSYNITAMSGTDFNMTNNSTKVNFLAASVYASDPVMQGFETATFPPALWTIVNSNGGSNFSRYAAGGAYLLSPSSMKYDFYNNTVVGDKDELYLPPADLWGFANPVLSFDLAYAQRTANSDDKIEVFISDDCGANWKNVYTNSGVNMATAPMVANAYAPNPNDPSNWISVSLSSELAGFNKNSVLVKFVATADGNGNNLYLDNINLSQTQTGLTKLNSSISEVVVYPNPSNGTTTVKLGSNGANTASLKLVNTLGQVAFSKQVDLVAGSNEINIDVKDLAAGVYNVLVTSQENTVVRKLTVTK